jgi:hypothetical protein
LITNLDLSTLEEIEQQCCQYQKDWSKFGNTNSDRYIQALWDAARKIKGATPVPALPSPFIDGTRAATLQESLRALDVLLKWRGEAELPTLAYELRVFLDKIDPNIIQAVLRERQPIAVNIPDYMRENFDHLQKNRSLPSLATFHPNGNRLDSPRGMTTGYYLFFTRQLVPLIAP